MKPETGSISDSGQPISPISLPYVVVIFLPPIRVKPYKTYIPSISRCRSEPISLPYVVVVFLHPSLRSELISLSLPS
ncbi:hypothetical protein ACLOJK_009450 [Asimina triloba]